MSDVQPAQQMYLRGSSIEMDRLSPLRSCPSSAQDGQRVTLLCPTVRSLVAMWSRMRNSRPPMGLQITGSAFGFGMGNCGGMAFPAINRASWSPVILGSESVVSQCLWGRSRKYKLSYKLAQR
jgi:hypothetical protein